MKAILLNVLWSILRQPAALGSVVLRCVVVALCWKGGPWVALLAALLLFSESFAGLLLRRQAQAGTPPLDPRESEGR